MRGVRLSACAVGTFVAAAWVGFSGSASGQVVQPEVIAYSGMPVPGEPGVVLAGGFSSLVSSPDGGLVAFSALHQGGPVFRHRNGQLQRLVTSGDAAPGPLPSGSLIINPGATAATNAGDVVIRSGITGSPSSAGLFVARAGSGALESIAHMGQAVPGLPGRAVDQFFGPTSSLFGQPQVQPETGPLLAFFSVNPPGIGGQTIERVVQRVGVGTSSVIAYSGPTLTNAFREVLAPSDIAGDGDMLFMSWAWEGTFVRKGVWRWDAATNQNVPVIKQGDMAPGLLNIVADVFEHAINGDGAVAAFVSVQGWGEGVVMGQGVGQAMVLRAGQTIPTGAGDITIMNFAPSGTSQRAITLAEDGWAYVWAQCLHLAQGTQVRPAVIRVRPGTAPQMVMWGDEEVRGAPPGTRMGMGTVIDRLFTASWSDRIVMSVQFGAAGSWTGKRAFVTWDDDGAPLALLAGGETIQTATGSTLTLGAVLVPSTAPIESVVIPDSSRGFTAVVNLTNGRAVVRIPHADLPCNDTDFNNDGLYPDTSDIQDFLTVFAGGMCPTVRCDALDFNRDGVSPDTADIQGLLTVFAGGACG